MNILYAKYLSTQAPAGFAPVAIGPLRLERLSQPIRSQASKATGATRSHDRSHRAVLSALRRPRLGLHASRVSRLWPRASARLHLILQVWGGDPLECPCCKGTMKIIRHMPAPRGGGIPSAPSRSLGRRGASAATATADIRYRDTAPHPRRSTPFSPSSDRRLRLFSALGEKQIPSIAKMPKKKR